MPVLTLKFKNEFIKDYRLGKGQSMTIGRRNDSNMIIENCTFYMNKAHMGGAFLGHRSDVTFNNCILWGDLAMEGGAEIALFHNSVTVINSDVMGGKGGVYLADDDVLNWEVGNIDIEPFFKDSSSSVFHLRLDSPCIDAGNNSLVTDATDLDGNPRIDNGIVDMGAYEFIHPVKVSVDIKPQSCPNPVNVKSKGVLPVAILGSDVLDVTDIELDTILLEGVGPLRGSYEDVANPVIDETECACTSEGADGYMDLTLKFEIQDIITALGDVFDGEMWMLHLTGKLKDGTPIEGTDCIVIKKKGKK